MFRLPPHEIIHGIGASPDGFVFVSTFSGHIYRSGPDGGEPWQLIATGPGSLSLIPVSRNVLFAYTYSHTWRWHEGEGLREDTTQFTGERLTCGDYMLGLELTGGWVRNDSDAYVAGSAGRVLRFDGSAWHVEANPLAAAAGNPCFAAYSLNLHAVGHDGATIYAGNGRMIRRLADGMWHEVALPVRRGYERYVGAIAQTSDGPLFAIGYYKDGSNNGQTVSFWHLTPNGWREAGPAPPTFYQADHGSGDGHGVAEFSAYWGSVVVVQDGRVRMWDLSHFQFRGAAATSGAVFVAGRVRDTALVARLQF